MQVWQGEGLTDVQETIEWLQSCALVDNLKQLQGLQQSEDEARFELWRLVTGSDVRSALQCFNYRAKILASFEDCLIPDISQLQCHLTRVPCAARLPSLNAHLESRANQNV